MALSEGLALVFDLDGVIIDSMPMHTKAWHAYLQRCGIAYDNIERMHGRRNDHIVLDFIGSQLTAAEVFAHGAAKERLYREMMSVEFQSHLVPGVVDFLRRYQTAPIAVASNAEPANIDFTLDTAHLRHYFKVIVNGMQVRNPKPFPDIYLQAADKLGVAARNCIVFEDSPTGVEAARAAGTRVVGVETYSPLDGVDFKVPDFQGDVLDGWISEQRVS